MVEDAHLDDNTLPSASFAPLRDEIRMFMRLSWIRCLSSVLCMSLMN